MRIVARWLVAALWLLAGTGHAAPTLAYRIIASYPHDSSAFTEGLSIAGDRLYESTGYYGASRILIRRLRGGELLNQYRLADTDFGEGLVVAGNKLVQLTWQRGIGYEYDLKLKPKRSFPLSSEGWGLAWDRHQLIRSDGSATLRVLDPSDYHELRSVTVRDGFQPIERLNELEYAEGRLYANVWQTDAIAVIDPARGFVLGWLDLTALKASFDKPPGWNAQDNVLNGIAFDPVTKHFFVTGKCWPTLFEIAIDTGKPGKSK